MINRSLRLFLLGALLLTPLCAPAENDYKFSGLVKAQSTIHDYDANSFYNRIGDSPQEQYNIDARLIYRQQRGNWDWSAHYQVSLQKSKLALQNVFGTGAAVDADRYRLWNLTRDISDSSRIENIQRLDRLYIRYSLDQLVIKAGRQAISWGHGQFFNPLDIANPFDPILVDKEYKAGDDMLYLQWLQQNGNDVQMAIIPRRDNSGKLQTEQSTSAAKYRGLWHNLDYDLLLARHYNENILGLGANIPWRESNINSDWLASKIDNDPNRSWVVIATLGISYSWVWWHKNFLGRAELFHNGFGMSGTPLDLQRLFNNSALETRLRRGELYTLAKNYLAAGLNIELHPLFIMDVNLFVNLHDPSATLQILGVYNQSDYSNISAGLAIPLGADTSEYGGLESGLGDYLSRQYSIFVKYAYYF